MVHLPLVLLVRCLLARVLQALRLLPPLALHVRPLPLPRLAPVLPVLHLQLPPLLPLEHVRLALLPPHLVPRLNAPRLRVRLPRLLPR